MEKYIRPIDEVPGTTASAVRGALLSLRDGGSHVRLMNTATRAGRR